jgi:hypothetical protein
MPWVLPAVLLAPSAYWIASDRSVWSWDPAFYGMGAVDLWRELTRGPGPWLDAMRWVFSAKAPAIAWIGQFFVPLGAWLGSIETALLASVVLAQLGALALVYRAARLQGGGGAPLAPIVAVLFLAASPLFVSMSHHFFTEALQLFTIAYVYWAAAGARSRPPVATLLHLLLAGALGVAAKIATPAFVAFPAGLAAWRAVRLLSRSTALAVRRRDIPLAIVTSAVVVLTARWYLQNASAAVAFARWASAGDVALDYGRRGTVPAKLLYWTEGLGRAHLAPGIGAVLLALAGAGVVALLVRRGRLPSAENGGGDRALVVAAALQVALVFAILAVTINEDTRYLLALSPALVVLLVAGIASAHGRGRALVVATAATLCVQWALVNGRTLDLVPSAGRGYWDGPPASRRDVMRELSSVVEATCDERSVGRFSAVGVNLDWLNAFTLRFFSAKASLGSGLRCDYEYLGHAPAEEAAWARLVELDPPYFVSLAAGAMPPPDFLNAAALPVLRRVERDPRFVPEPFASQAGIVIFSRAPPAAGPR